MSTSMPGNAKKQKDAAKANVIDYGFLTVEPRLLTSGKHTIATHNIASLSTSMRVRPAIKARSKLAGWIIAASLLAALVIWQLSSAMHVYQPIWYGLIILSGLAGIAFGATRPLIDKVAERRQYLLEINCNNGGNFVFSSPIKETVDAVRRIISDKINDVDKASTYNINFESGTIEHMNFGNVGAVGAIVSGSNNTVSGAAGNGRVGTADTYMQATNSPGAQIGDSNVAAGNTYPIDYSQVLPEIENMRRYYSQQDSTRELASRLLELEALLRSGTPTGESKGKLRQLLTDLGTILQAYPSMVQFFESIAKIAGF